jgi:predicted  nucleic acid-binding Zn-ribbon protein
MAWTATEEKRIQAIELKLNELQEALNALATKAQLKQLVNIRQSEIETLKSQVASLQAQVLALQS